MKYLAILASVLLISFSSCSDEDLPICVEEILTDFRTDACIGSGEFTTWRFRGQTVYCFDFGSCEPIRFIEIYDADCILVCELGGTNGINVCDGTEWSSAEFISTVFRR